MASGFSDVFAALATGDPHSGRKMRLAETMQSQNYDIENRRTLMAEALAPTQLDILQTNLEVMGQELHEMIRTRPYRITEIESNSKLTRTLNDLLQRSIDQSRTETQAKTNTLTDAVDGVLSKLKQGWGAMTAGGGKGAQGVAMSMLGAPVDAASYGGTTGTTGKAPSLQTSAAEPSVSALRALLDRMDPERAPMARPSPLAPADTRLDSRRGVARRRAGGMADLFKNRAFQYSTPNRGAATSLQGLLDLLEQRGLGDDLSGIDSLGVMQLDALERELERIGVGYERSASPPQGALQRLFGG